MHRTRSRPARGVRAFAHTRPSRRALTAQRLLLERVLRSGVQSRRLLFPLLGGLALLVALAITLAPRGKAEPAVARAEAPTTQTAVVAGTDGSGVRVRSGPSREYATLATLPEGASLTILGGPRSDGERDWYEVERADVGGRPLHGWAAGQYLALGLQPGVTGPTLAGPGPRSRLTD